MPAPWTVPAGTPGAGREWWAVMASVRHDEAHLVRCVCQRGRLPREADADEVLSAFERRLRQVPRDGPRRRQQRRAFGGHGPSVRCRDGEREFSAVAPLRQPRRRAAKLREGPRVFWGGLAASARRHSYPAVRRTVLSRSAFRRRAHAPLRIWTSGSGGASARFAAFT